MWKNSLDSLHLTQPSKHDAANTPCLVHLQPSGPYVKVPRWICVQFLCEQQISAEHVWVLPGDKALRRDARQRRHKSREGQAESYGQVTEEGEKRRFILEAIKLNLPSRAFRRTVLATIFSISIVRMWIPSSRDTFHSEEKRRFFWSNVPTTVRLLHARKADSALAHSRSFNSGRRSSPLQDVLSNPTYTAIRLRRGLLAFTASLPSLSACFPSCFSSLLLLFFLLLLLAPSLHNEPARAGGINLQAAQLHTDPHTSAFMYTCMHVQDLTSWNCLWLCHLFGIKTCLCVRFFPSFSREEKHNVIHWELTGKI